MTRRLFFVMADAGGVFDVGETPGGKSPEGTLHGAAPRTGARCD
jgi:hypothetical protein